jgi:hypothetical protein
MNEVILHPADVFTLDNSQTMNLYPDVDTFILEEGEYKIESLLYNNTDRFITVKGAGIDKTILRGWDYVNNCDNRLFWMNDISNIRYENLTILNRGIEQYGGEGVDHTGRKFELVNVKHEFTIGHPGGYACYLITKGLQIYFRNYEVKNYVDSAVYAGIWIEDGIVDIEECKVGDYFEKPFVCQGPVAPHVNNVSTKGGITGVFFGANKLHPMDGFIIENCIGDGAEEECLSFDCFGNNVDLNPCIAELSVSSAVLTDTLKLYCDARTIVGVHPNEYYEDYLFAGNEVYLEQFYVCFSQLSGVGFAGVVAKVLDVGTDETGQYIIVDTDINPATLTLNDYKSVSVMSGFFNGIVRNNIVKNGTATGLALFAAFFNNLVDGNTEQNCAGGSYLYAASMLALGVWNGANGNTIENNRFENGFSFTKYGGAKGYNNSFIDNETESLVINDEVNLTEEGTVYI